MRITNLRRGRIARMAGGCAVLLLLMYALHKWSSENIANGDTDEIVDSFAEVGYYKFHRDVYPTLKSGEKCKHSFSYHFISLGPVRELSAEIQLDALVNLPACLRPRCIVFIRHLIPRNEI